MKDALEVWIDDRELAPQAEPVGTLARTRARGHEVVRFRYAATWLSGGRHAFALEPELPLTPGDFHPALGQGLHRIFRDSAPDRWGRVLMERREAELAHRELRRARSLDEWDFLAGVNDLARMGATTSAPPSSSCTSWRLPRGSPCPRPSWSASGAGTTRSACNPSTASRRAAACTRPR